MKDEHTLCYLPFDDSVTYDECENNIWQVYSGAIKPVIYNTEENSKYFNDKTFKNQLQPGGGLKLSAIKFSPQKFTISIWLWIKKPLEGSVQNINKYIYRIKGKNIGPGNSYYDSFINEISLLYQPNYNKKTNHLLTLYFDLHSTELFKYIAGNKFNKWHNITFCVNTPDNKNPYKRNHYIFIDGKQVDGWEKIFNNEDYIKEDTWTISLGSQSDTIDKALSGYIKNFEISKIARSIGNIFNLYLTFNTSQLSQDYGELPGGLGDNNDVVTDNEYTDNNKDADIVSIKNYIINNNYINNKAVNTTNNQAPFEMIAILNNNSTMPKGNIIFIYPAKNLDLKQYDTTISYIANGGLVYQCSGTENKLELVDSIGECKYKVLKAKSTANPVELNFKYNYGIYTLFGTLEFWTYIDFTDSIEHKIFKLEGVDNDSITINLSNTSWNIIPVGDSDMASYIKNGNNITKNNWTHIAISFTGTYIDIFINGEKALQIENSLFSNLLNNISFYLWNNINYITNIRFSDFLRYGSNNFSITIPESAYNINEDITITQIASDNE